MMMLKHRPNRLLSNYFAWLVPAALVVFALGCESDPADVDGGELTPTAQAFVQEVVQKLVDDAQWVSNFSHEAPQGGFPELGYSHTLIGVDEAARGILVLAPDAPLGAFDPSCDSDAPEPPDSGIWEERDRCFRISRISERRWTADVYFTVEPRREPDDRHPFSYETGDGRGVMTFDRNPLISWVVDLQAGGAASVAASVERNVAFDAFEGAALDLSHTASVAAYHDDPTRTTDSFELTFSGFGSEEDLSVTLEVENIEPFTAAGWVRLGERVLAEIAGTAPDLSFAWE